MELIRKLIQQRDCWKTGENYEDVLEKVKNNKNDPKWDPNVKYQNNTYFGEYDIEGMTPYHLAAYAGCEIELFQAILEKVTDVNDERNTETALMLVCQRPKSQHRNDYWQVGTYQNALQMIEILLAHKSIDVNKRDQYGNNALMHAIMIFGSASRKAPEDFKSKKYKNKILEERKIGIEIMNAFFKNKDFMPAVMNNTNQNLLHLAALHGCEPDTFEAILKKVVPTKDSYGNTALMQLVTVEKKKTVTDPWTNVDYMMKEMSKIDPNAINNSGETALVRAVRQKNAKTVELLLKYTTEIDATIPYQYKGPVTPREKKILEIYNNKTAVEIAKIDKQHEILRIIADYQTKLACKCSKLQACAMPRFKF